MAKVAVQCGALQCSAWGSMHYAIYPPSSAATLQLFPLWAAAEQKHEEEKRKLGAADRVALALGRPFTNKSSTVCKLHLQVGSASGQ